MDKKNFFFFSKNKEKKFQSALFSPLGRWTGNNFLFKVGLDTPNPPPFKKKKKQYRLATATAPHNSDHKMCLFLAQEYPPLRLCPRSAQGDIRQTRPLDPRTTDPSVLLVHWASSHHSFPSPCQKQHGTRKSILLNLTKVRVPTQILF